MTTPTVPYRLLYNTSHIAIYLDALRLEEQLFDFFDEMETGKRFIPPELEPKIQLANRYIDQIKIVNGDRVEHISINGDTIYYYIPGKFVVDDGQRYYRFYYPIQYAYIGVVLPRTTNLQTIPGLDDEPWETIDLTETTAHWATWTQLNLI